MNEPYFNRNVTNVLKGIALIFMFAHHFFTFPWLNGEKYPWLVGTINEACMPLRICVVIFAFLTGYFYYFCKTPDLKYSIKKITGLLVPYQIIFLIFMLVATALGTYVFDFKHFVLELFGVYHTIMVFCWYVYFYYVVMLALPVMSPILASSKLKAIVFGIIIPIIIMAVFAKVVPSERIAGMIETIGLYFPVTIVGYMYARYGVFESIDKAYEGKINCKFFKCIVMAALVMVVLFARYYVQWITVGTVRFGNSNIPLEFTMDIIYAPIVVYALINLIKIIKVDKIHKVIASIGKHSLTMWFVSCIFFSTTTRDVFQPILYFPRNPILILVWGLVMCYVVAFAIDFVANKIKWRLVWKI